MSTSESSPLEPEHPEWYHLGKAIEPPVVPGRPEAIDDASLRPSIEELEMRWRYEDARQPFPWSVVIIFFMLLLIVAGCFAYAWYAWPVSKY